MTLPFESLIYWWFYLLCFCIANQACTCRRRNNENTLRILPINYHLVCRWKEPSVSCLHTEKFIALSIHQIKEYVVRRWGQRIYGAIERRMAHFLRDRFVTNLFRIYPNVFRIFPNLLEFSNRIKALRPRKPKSRSQQKCNFPTVILWVRLTRSSYRCTDPIWISITLKTVDNASAGSSSRLKRGHFFIHSFRPSSHKWRKCYHKILINLPCRRNANKSIYFELNR